MTDAHPTDRRAMSLARDRRRIVAQRLRALGPPRHARRAPPPEGRLGADEQRVGQLRAALAALGPVFAAFGRYLSTRVDLLARRDCLELAAIADRDEDVPPFDAAALVARELGGPERPFFRFEPEPRARTIWTQQHDAWLAPAVPVAVTIVRPDAEARLNDDLPLLILLAPWFAVPDGAFQAAVDDFAITLRRRLDQRSLAAAFTRLADDDRQQGTFGAPTCYRDYCTSHVLTAAPVEGLTVAECLDSRGKTLRGAPPDRDQIANQLALAWLRQALDGQLVPFDFDLRDLRLHAGGLVLTGGVFEPQTADGRERLLNYLSSAAADDTDGAAAWIVSSAARGPGGELEDGLLRRLRQVVPFRDGEWSGDDRLSEQLLVHWRATAQAGWMLVPPALHVYRGLQSLGAALATLSPTDDHLLAALRSERLRLGIRGAQRLVDSRAWPAAMDRLLQDMVNLPRQLDQILTQAADGRLRIRLHVPDAAEHRRVRNRTVSLVVSLVVLTGLAVLVRQLTPGWGANVERLGAVMLLIVGAWLLAAAARL